LQLAEDVVQEALVRALQTWPYYGVPQNPAAWLTQTAKHLALDLIRREHRFREKEPQITTFIEQWNAEPGEADAPLFESEIQDRLLRLIFACCHPDIPPEAQTALALKTLCGFSPAEIGKAFLTSEAAITKRLTRARQHIRDRGIPFEIPSGPELEGRLETVLQTLYLLFNEGYKASAGEQLVREELCREAIRLTSLLVAHPAGQTPRSHALLALMLLSSARFPSRVSEGGDLLRLADQDRSKWDRELIARGLRHLAESACGDELTEYHLQAGIAACHCLAADVESTDWPRILRLYDQLQCLKPSPLVALNRAVAVAHVHGPQAGLLAIAAIPDRERLESHHLLHAVIGELHWQLKDHRAAAESFRRALGLAEVGPEQLHLTRMLDRTGQPAEQAARLSIAS
jgi:RNA polymerase sigma-70 factor (ECF subfamily)